MDVYEKLKEIGLQLPPPPAIGLPQFPAIGLPQLPPPPFRPPPSGHALPCRFLRQALRLVRTALAFVVDDAGGIFQDGRVRWVGPATAAPPATGAEIDGRGKWLIPGLGIALVAGGLMGAGTHSKLEQETHSGEAYRPEPTS